jgi:NTE family protein
MLVSCAQTKEAIIEPRPKPAKVALVLGAGASRGFAHIGVIKVLEANGVPVHMVVGTSAGSFVGSLYASGMDGYQLQSLAISVQKGDIADICLPDNGFIKGELLEAFVNRQVKNLPMEKLKLPFYAVATNIQTGKEMVFGRGNTGTAVRASCSIPGIFRPVVAGGQMYVDGGVVSPIAIDAAKRQGADIVIAVDISSDRDKSQPNGTMATILQSVNIMYSKISENQLPRADVVIRPKVGAFGSANFDKRHEAIMEGEKAANEAMPKIKELMDG